jgi:hypothetical protein
VYKLYSGSPQLESPLVPSILIDMTVGFPVSAEEHWNSDL